VLLVRLTRREFFKMVAMLGVAATLNKLDTLEAEMIEAFKSDVVETFTKAAKGEVRVAWLQGAGCTGCTISLLQGTHPDLVEAIERFRLSIDFHPTIMLPAGEEALEPLFAFKNGAIPLDVLIVEGAVPEGSFCTVGEVNDTPIAFEEWVRSLGMRAKAVVAVGTCASFGGIPGGRPNPTNARPVSRILPERTVINIPGCPPHPDWILLTLFAVLKGYDVPLDELGRPKLFFGELIHDNCQRRQYYEQGRFATKPGESGCLVRIGCRGPIAYSDCPYRKWNGGVNWCIQADAPCCACVHPDFPDLPTSPFYTEFKPVELTPPPEKPSFIDSRVLAGLVAATAAAGAVAAYKAKPVEEG